MGSFISGEPCAHHCSHHTQRTMPEVCVCKPHLVSHHTRRICRVGNRLIRTTHSHITSHQDRHNSQRRKGVCGAEAKLYTSHSIHAQACVGSSYSFCKTRTVKLSSRATTLVHSHVANAASPTHAIPSGIFLL